MYQEQPGYKLMFNTLCAMYQRHPIRVDIACSVESIYDITKDDLYLCYETFHHPSNMVLFGRRRRESRRNMSNSKTTRGCS